MAAENFDNVLFPRYLYRKNLAYYLLKDKFGRFASFLEVGAGRGDFAEMLSARIKSGDVIESSAEAAKLLAGKFAAGNVRVLSGDFLDYRFDKKYSLLVMLEVLEHIEKDEAALLKAGSLLEDGGYFLLSVPAHRRKWSASDEAAGHYRRYDKAPLKKTLANCGFEIIFFTDYGFPLLNLISLVSRRLFKTNFRKIDRPGGKEKLSEKSGLGYLGLFGFGRWIKTAIKIFFAGRLIRFYVFLSKPWQGHDLGDGYLCLMKKNDLC